MLIDETGSALVPAACVRLRPRRMAILPVALKGSLSYFVHCCGVP